MNAFALAVRNVLRNRRRSLTTLLAMVLGIAAILLFGGYRQSIAYGLETAYVQRGGHLQVQHRDYFLYGSGNPGAYGIAHADALVERLRHDATLAPMLAVTTPVLQLNGIAGNFVRGVSRTALATGVIPEDQNRMRAWNEYGTAGTPRPGALTGTAEDKIVIGTGLARTLQLCEPLRVTNCVDSGPAAAASPSSSTTATAPAADAPADILALTAAERRPEAARSPTQVELLVAHPNGAPDIAALEAVKAEDMGVKEIDDVFVSMHLAQAQRLLYGHDAPRVTAIQVQLHRSEDGPAAQARIREILASDPQYADFDVLDFRKLNPSFGQINAMFGAVFAAVSLLIAVIVLFTVSNTMSMVVMERTAEIGTLRAIGLRRGGVRRLFLCEGLVMGAASAVLGVVLALAVAAAVNHSGLSWTPPGRVDAVQISVRLWGEARLILASAIGLLVVAALSAWWPARRASRLNIVDALRHA